MLSVKSNGIISNCSGIASFWIKTRNALNSDIMIFATFCPTMNSTAGNWILS